MAEEAKSRLTQQTLTRALANAGNINATTTEISGALNSIVQGILNYDFKDDVKEVQKAVATNYITTSTYIYFNKQVQLTSDVLKQANNK
jgi:FKBP-type peptidyl-prolyl cis-trans isomerase (trigger factor)